jgi:hypothetical protein
MSKDIKNKIYYDLLSKETQDKIIGEAKEHGFLMDAGKWEEIRKCGVQLVELIQGRYLECKVYVSAEYLGEFMARHENNEDDPSVMW